MRCSTVPLGLLLGLVGLVGAGCSGEPSSSDAPRPVRSTDAVPSTSDGQPPSEPSTWRDLEPLVAPMRLRAIRWAEGNLPRRVPTVDEALPSALEDPPGRALVASYVPRDAAGLDGEAIELYGVDGRWRRLALGDLDLPDDGWEGGDTYGAGALSPDGRRWAGPMRDGMFLVDLETGETVVRRLDGGGGMASFSWAPDSDELVLVLAGRSHRVSVPDLVVEPFPRPGAYPQLRADGGWWECPERRRRVEACLSFDASGAGAGRRVVPDDLVTRWAAPTEIRERRSFYSVSTGPYGNSFHDWEVLRTDDGFRADARLRLPHDSQVDGVMDAFDDDTLGLASIGHRTLLAWLVDDDEIVRTIRPGVVGPDVGTDWWDVSFARDLVVIR